MTVPANLKKRVAEFKAQNSLDATSEHLATTLHLMCEHKMEVDQALDQSARSGNDLGIDGWHITPTNEDLVIYQSKFTDSKKQALKGLDDLKRAADFLEAALCDEDVPSKGAAHSTYGLLNKIAEHRDEISNVQLRLLTLSDADGITNSGEYDRLIEHLKDSRLHKLLVARDGGIELDVDRHNFKKGVPRIKKSYPVETFPETSISLRPGVTLRIAYLSLAGLVRLYRERGTYLFDKNVRLSLLSYKESDRVASPMEQTLKAICDGVLSPEIFPYYHVGITIWASDQEEDSSQILNLRSPSVVNGCQTVTIADRFLKRLEKTGTKEAMALFGKIHVMAKVVIGANEDELREITNSNNRQNPIDNWQLYSNEPIHIEIEEELKEIGIFYERQKGKYDSLYRERKLDLLDEYPKTHGTHVDITELAQIAALCRGDLKKAAKFSEVFANQKSHEDVFNSKIVRDIRYVAITSNLLKASKRAFKKILKECKQEESKYDFDLLDKPITRCHFWHLGMAYGIQKLDEADYEKHYQHLSKIAPSNLVDELASLFSGIIKEVMRFYWKETDKGTFELKQRERTQFFRDLASRKGLNLNSLPFK